MSDRAGRVALARVHDRDALAVVADEDARVAGLAAAERIEDRAVELDCPSRAAATRAVAVLRYASSLNSSSVIKGDGHYFKGDGHLCMTR